LLLPGLNSLPHLVPAPKTQGSATWSGSASAFWRNPTATEAIECTGCHDNGGFIRSRYLAQLKGNANPLHNFPFTFDNNAGLGPPRYVGAAYSMRQSHKITTTNDPSDTGPNCTTCHVLAVSNRPAFGLAPNGTAKVMALTATASSQASKIAHTANNPIWMRPCGTLPCAPGTYGYHAAAEKSAKKYSVCAQTWYTSHVAGPGCTVTPWGGPYVPPVPPKTPLQKCYDGCGTANTACNSDGQTLGKVCAKEYQECKAECLSLFP
jgi:hypothetical protein